MGRVQEVLDGYQLINSKLDLFSKEADNERRVAWGEGKLGRGSGEGTPRTTAAFILGYDWDIEVSAFDEAAKMVQDDFEDSYGDWVPNISDD